LFFISVGMTIDFGLLFDIPLLIIGLTVILMVGKALVLYAIAVLTNVAKHQRLLFSCLFAQSGEFGFVLFGFAVTAGAITDSMSDKLILVVAMSMLFTPLLMLVHDRYLVPKPTESDRPADEIEEDNAVILVGFGRIGQVIGRMLHANHITPTVIDHDPDHIERVRRFGYKTYYGDVLKHDVLHSIGAEKAKIIILTGGDPESTNLAVDMIHRDFPNLTIVARAKDRDHAMHLIDNGVTAVTRETFYSAVEMGKKTLRQIGIDEGHIEKMAATYTRHDVQTLYTQVDSRHDEKALISIAKNAREQLEQILEADRKDTEDSESEPSN